MRPPGQVLVITDRSQAGASLDDTVASLLGVGARWFSLREKDLAWDEQIALVRRLRPGIRAEGGILTVHGPVELALAADACGVHLDRHGDVGAARRRLGPDKLLGFSAHDLDGVRAAAAAGADYVTLSPVFPSASKTGQPPALGLDGLLRIAAAATVPVIALSGVTIANAASCFAHGACGVAVMGAAMRKPDAMRDFFSL